MTKLNFDGKGFSKEEPTPQELSEWRERQKHYDDHFRTIEEFLDETGLAWVARAAKGFPAYLKAFAAVSIIAAGFAALKSWGVF